jgi:PhnB protein
MQFIAHLDFDGTCRQAFDYYAKVFRGVLVSRMTWGEAPTSDPTPPEWRDRIMHCALDGGGGLIMGADAPPGTPPSGGCVNAQVTDPEEAERIFAALADGGTVQMPLQETFWAQRFGLVTDRFGKAWMVNCMKSVA